MFNLLALIVSIALGSAMAAAGVYYGGSVLTAAGAKAQGVEVIASLQQVDAAWVVYSNDGKTNSAAFPTLSGGASGTDLTVDGYLASPPNAPNFATTWAAAGAQAAGFYLDRVAGGGAESTETGTFIILSTSAGGTCLAIAQSAGAASATATTLPGSLQNVTDPASLTTALGTRKYGCVQLGANPATLTLAGVSLVAGDGSKYLAFYKH